jgi:DNA-binding transcriptional regulator YdaS (Cro superfamily)
MSLFANNRTRSPECLRALSAGGGVTVVARVLGLSTNAVRGWFQIPAEHLPRMEMLTKIPGREIRPDLYRPLIVPVLTKRERAQMTTIDQADAR